MENIKIIENFISFELGWDYFDILSRETPWTDTLTNVRTGDPVKIKRKMAYIADVATDYKYADLSFKGYSFNEPGNFTTPALIMRCDLETELGKPFNSVLLNMYKDGRDEIKWHSDKEDTLGPNPVIACINLGATRKFWFRHKEPGSEKFFVKVNHGDLLVMGEDCQSQYLHAILKEKDVTSSRISLTFRYNKDSW